MRSPLDDATRTQLRLLAEVSAALDRAGITWWLFGGWAMDAHAGEVTRNHADVEVFVLASEAVRARDALTQAGFTAFPSLHPGEGTPFIKENQEIGLTYLDTFGEELRISGRWRDWQLPVDSFGASRLELAGLAVPAMSLRGLIEMKTGFAAQPHGAPAREKDVEDVARLRAMLSRLTGPG